MVRLVLSTKLVKVDGQSNKIRHFSSKQIHNAILLIYKDNNINTTALKQFCTRTQQFCTLIICVFSFLIVILQSISKSHITQNQTNMHRNLFCTLNLLGYMFLFLNLWMGKVSLLIIGIVLVLSSIVCRRVLYWNYSKHKDAQDINFYRGQDISDMVFLTLYVIGFLYKCYHMPI